MATGQIAGAPWHDPKSEWRASHFAPISNVRMLESELSLADLRAKLPNWRRRWPYLKNCQGSVTVPESIAPLLSKILSSGERRGVGPTYLRSNRGRDLHFASIKQATEGLVTEVRQLRRSRDPRLRASALFASRSVCEVCGRDFGKLLGGRGERVLQVHHKRQLASTTMPRRTSVADLAVVCANCHLLIHEDPRRARKVGALAHEVRQAMRTWR